MKDAIEEIRVRAEILHRRAGAQDAAALRRFRKLPGFDPANVRRRDCLGVLSAEMGFANWPQAKRALSGEDTSDFGALLCPPKCSSHLNLWYKTHEEATDVQRRRRGGYLLGFRHQFVVVDRYYIDDLGLDPDDPDWAVLGFDWTCADAVRPGCAAARARLYAKLVAALPREAAG